MHGANVRASLLGASVFVVVVVVVGAGVVVVVVGGSAPIGHQRHVFAPLPPAHESLGPETVVHVHVGHPVSDGRVACDSAHVPPADSAPLRLHGATVHPASWGGGGG